MIAELKKDMGSLLDKMKNEMKNNNQRLDGPQRQLQQSRPAEVGTQEGKTCELEEIATEAHVGLANL